MRKILKKSLALLMSVVLVVTLVPTNALDSSAVENTEQDISYNATNSLGEVLSNAMEAETEENNGYFIQDITVEDLVAEATISAPDNATLVVAIYDEKSGEMITSGKASVGSATEYAEVELGECEMPEFFVVKAFLLDSENAPICQNYEDISYTKAYQEFLSKTTEDFDEEQVINLDSSIESNFAVVSDEAVIVEQSLGANTIVTNDYDNGIYSFENAGEELKSLESGDVLYYVYGDGPEDYILTKVGEIEADDDTVTFTVADEFEIGDLFSYIKIDTSKAAYEQEEPVLSGAHYDDDSGDMDDYSQEHKFTVTKEFESTEHVSASFTGELGFKFYLQFYYDYRLFGEDYYELTQMTTTTFTGSTEIKAEAEHEWEPLIFFHGGIPVYAGLEAEVEVVLTIKISAQISVSGGIEFEMVNGSRKISGSPEQDLSKEPSVVLKFSVEGKAVFNFTPSFSVGLKVLKVFKVSLGVAADFEISATAAIIDVDSDNLFSSDVLHSCSLCIDGDVHVSVSGNITFNFGLHKKKQKTILEINLFTIKRKLGDFYISFMALEDGTLSFVDFGFGECEFYDYKVTFNVVDENGKPLENVKISDDVNVLETDSEGKAYCYYKDGTYTYTITRDGYEIDTLKMNFDELVFVVHGDTVTVNVYMKKAGGSSDTDTPENPSVPDTPNESVVLDSGTCGNNLTWTLYNDGELVISGTGDMYNWYSCDDVPWYSNQPEIKSVTIGGSVTSIGDSAFADCGNLASVTIGNSVTSIGDYTFYWCENLTSVTIPDSVISIGESAFGLCFSLTSVTIPDSVTSIGDDAFEACESLTSITVDPANTAYSSDECGVLFNKDKTALIQYPAGNTRTSYVVPDSVIIIYDGAFCYCDSLTSVTIPDSVISIGDYAFYSCESLTSVTIPDSVTSIGDDAFEDCDSLTNITVDSANKTYSNDEKGVLFNKDKTELIQYPIGNTRTSYAIPDSVTSIGECAFDCCTSLASVTIPDSVTSIGYGAFCSCDSLTDVYYTGTEEQWNAISIGSYNEDLTSANIVYNYVIPETVSLNSSSSAVALSGSSGSSKTVYNAQEGYFYTVMAVKNKSASDLLSNENLLFIDQKTAENSTLTFDVVVPDSVTDYEIIITTNAPDDPEDEPSVPSTEPSTEPSTKPVEVPTTTKPAETEPSTKPVEVPTTTKPAETEPSTKPVEVPTTTKPAETEPSTKPIVTVSVPSVEIRRPSQTEIKYGDSIILHADVKNLPEGAKIVWTADNANFKIVSYSDDKTTCTVTPAANGDTVFTATVVDADGNEIGSDTQTMTSKAGFFQKIIAFFKKLFGMTKIIPEVFKEIL